MASTDLTGTPAGWGTTGVPLRTDTEAEADAMAGATSVTVVPSFTTVVCLSVVVTGAAEVSGVLSALGSADDADPVEVGLLDGVATAGTPAPVLASPLDGVEAAGAGADDLDDVSGNCGAVPTLDGGTLVMDGAALGATVGVSVRGASAVVDGTAADVDCGAVRVGVCTGGGASGVTTGSRVCSAGTGGGEAGTDGA